MFRNDFFEMQARLASYLRHVEKANYKDIGSELHLSAGRVREIVKSDARYCRWRMQHLAETMANEAAKINRVDELETELREIRKRINLALAKPEPRP